MSSHFLGHGKGGLGEEMGVEDLGGTERAQGVTTAGGKLSPARMGVPCQAPYSRPGRAIVRRRLRGSAECGARAAGPGTL